MNEKDKIASIINKAQSDYYKGSAEEWVDEAFFVADALIAAGIGDVSCLREHRVIAEYSLVPDDDNPYVIPNVPLRVTQLYSGEEVEKIVKERKELKDELRSKVEYIHEQDEVIKEYEHRSLVAEKALKTACVNIITDEEDDIAIEPRANVLYKAYLRNAEKELAEDKKDD